MNERPLRILLQTTIPATADDWHVGRFSLLRDHLATFADVTARDRATSGGENDPVLASFGLDDFDEIWLLAVDTGDGLTEDECENIGNFYKSGGGVLATRDHQDLGSSLCTLGGIGRAHYFHSKHEDPDEGRRGRDDEATRNISWPNYHSGSNGDYQRVEAVEPVHELLRRPDGSAIEHFPSHPHEGGVGAPPDAPEARVVARGTSGATDRPFNLLVAFERGEARGRAIAESSFHHLADYNWDVALGKPSFVEEAPGDGVAREPEKLDDVKAYVRNAALWLAPSAR